MTTQEERTLLEQASALSRDIPPERDLWPEIESAIAGQRSGDTRGRWRTPAALAASLLLALVVGYGVGREAPETAMVAETAAVGRDAGVSQTALQPVSLVEAAGLLAARRAMADEIEAGLEHLPPDARSVVIENLAAIGAALDEIDAVLAATPSSGLDRQVLMAMYVDQLALLGSVRQLVLQSNQEILL